MCDLYNKQINSFTPRKSRINSTAGSFLLLNISLLFILMVNIYPYEPFVLNYATTDIIGRRPQHDPKGPEAFVTIAPGLYRSIRSNQLQ
jgi:hypothetical protein